MNAKLRCPGGCEPIVRDLDALEYFAEQSKAISTFAVCAPRHDRFHAVVRGERLERLLADQFLEFMRRNPGQTTARFFPMLQ